jgi:GDP/UDP-N,N'-diacetylbacillosamine 2-epimerase (hydrolysing)
MRILAITSIRSDYDLMSGIYRALQARPDVEFRLLVGGAHLSPTYGLSVEDIRRDGLPILGEVECLLDGNTASSRVKTGAIFLQGAVDFIAMYKPDVVIFAGDREDALMAATAAAYLKIPSVHFFGGDHAADGNVDNPVRHAISKLSTFHFVTHAEHARRLQRMGEPAGRIHVVGNPALDKFRTEPYIDKADVLKQLGAPNFDEYALMIHHAKLGEESSAAGEVTTILTALQQTGVNALVGSPNTDAGGRDILRVYQQFQDDDRFFFYRNAPRSLFVNMLRGARFLIGNSSLGLLEAPTIRLPAVNVGTRQRGRLAGANVIFVDPDVDAIREAVERARSAEFRDSLKGLVSPYGDGQSVNRCVELIMQLDYAGWLYKTEDPLDAPI